jgi:YihY family inner membrane protein
MNAVERGFRRFDRYQQQHAVLAVPIAVLQKFGNDQAGGKAVLMAYYGLFALFPLLLLMATVLGFVLAGHPALQKHLLTTALANFPIISAQLQNDTHALKGSTLAVVVGILGTVYGAQGLGQSAVNAMNSVWNVPYKSWPNFFGRRLRGYFWLGVLGLASVGTTTIASFGTVWLHGPIGFLWTLVVSFIVNLGVFFVVFVVLTSEPLGWRDVALGVVIATVAWEALQELGGYYIRHSLAHANATYGFFAIVIGLLSWLFLAAQLTLYAAEINVVRRHHLWPRSLTQPPLTAADRATYQRLAMMEERRPEVKVAVSFTADADRQPLDTWPTDPDSPGAAPLADPGQLADPGPLVDPGPLDRSA